jgi:hypothetical protein
MPTRLSRPFSIRPIHILVSGGAVSIEGVSGIGGAASLVQQSRKLSTTFRQRECRAMTPAIRAFLVKLVTEK